MNLQKTGLFILAAIAAAMLAASAIDAEPSAAMALTPTHERPQGSPAAHPASTAPYNNLANTPAGATWGSIFSANWR